MASVLTSLPLGVVRRFQRRRAIPFGELLLPPPTLRLGGRHFRDDCAFVESGRQDVAKLHSVFDLDASSSLLDIGCGVGRLPIGLLAEIGDPCDYVGVDVNRTSIEWCKRHIEAHHPGVRFVHLDVANERYNKAGRQLDSTFRFPWDENRFDVIFLYSVFSHMCAEDVQVYLREFRRLLKPGGGVFLTAFVEEDVPDTVVNPTGYGPLRWSGALHCVRFSLDFFGRLIDEAGLMVVKHDHGTETDGQSAFYLVTAR